MRSFNRVFPAKSFKLHWDEMKAVMHEIDDANKQIHVLIEAEKKRRSTGYKSQNHHLNGHIQQIAMCTGQPFDDIKKYVKQMAIDMGYPMLMQFGRPVMDLWGNPQGISEADSTTDQCALLIEAAHRLASDLDIILQEEDIVS